MFCVMLFFVFLILCVQMIMRRKKFLMGWASPPPRSCRLWTISFIHVLWPVGFWVVQEYGKPLLTGKSVCIYFPKVNRYFAALCGKLVFQAIFSMVNQQKWWNFLRYTIGNPKGCLKKSGQPQPWFGSIFNMHENPNL